MLNTAVRTANELTRLRLLLGQAELAWARVVTLELEHQHKQEQRLALGQDFLWSLAGPDREPLDIRRARADAQLKSLSGRLATARGEALELSSKATHAGWGIRLGQLYRLSTPVSCMEVLADEARPLPAHDDNGCRMLLTARDRFGVRLFVLGQDELHIAPANSDVVDIRSRLAARRSTARA